MVVFKTGRAVVLVASSMMVLLTGCIQGGDSKTGALESAVEQNRLNQTSALAFQQETLAKQKEFIEAQREKQLAMLQKAPGDPAGRSPAQNKPEVVAPSGTSKSMRNQVPEAKVQKASVTANSRGANITYNSNWKCVPNSLKSVIYEVSRRYGHVTINSTHRSRSRNRRAGGAGGSYHLRCQAVDFRVRGNSSGVMNYLRRNPNVGGLKRYRTGFFHIDTGPRRTWR